MSTFLFKRLSHRLSALNSAHSGLVCRLFYEDAAGRTRCLPEDANNASEVRLRRGAENGIDGRPPAGYQRRVWPIDGAVRGLLVADAGMPFGPESAALLEDLLPLAQAALHDLGLHHWSEERWAEPLHFITGCRAMLAVTAKLNRFCQSKMPLLINGESGVGKEIFAKSHYLLGMPHEAPYYSFNCAQFQEGTLTVSELFGHKKGSFTGAVSDHVGLFEKADGGTVFLDEVGELPMAAQKMLLRALDQREIKPLGTNLVRKVNVRIVSATNRNLEAMVDAGTFREDLYYRLSTLMIVIPPLRERGDDWRLLLDFFLDTLNGLHGTAKRFSPEAMARLATYRFPGNVRELRNIVETGYWSATDDEIVSADFRLKQGGATPQGDGPNSLRRRLLQQMLHDGESYWLVVKQPFMERDMKRSEVRAVIEQGLRSSGGSYKKLLPLFNIPEVEYKKFIDHLRLYNLQPSSGKGV